MTPAPDFLPQKRSLRLGRLQVHCAGLAALVIFKIVGKALLLLERAEPGCLNSGDMDEGIIAPGFIRYEAIAFGTVEKFHFADWHI